MEDKLWKDQLYCTTCSTTKVHTVYDQQQNYTSYFEVLYEVLQVSTDSFYDGWVLCSIIVKEPVRLRRTEPAGKTAQNTLAVKFRFSQTHKLATRSQRWNHHIYYAASCLRHPTRPRAACFHSTYLSCDTYCTSFFPYRGVHSPRTLSLQTVVFIVDFVLVKIISNPSCLHLQPRREAAPPRCRQTRRQQR